MGAGFSKIRKKNSREKKEENEMIIYGQKCLLNAWAFLTIPYIPFAVNQYIYLNGNAI